MTGAKNIQPWKSKAELACFLDWITETHMKHAVPGFAGLDIGPTAACFDNKAAYLEGLSRLFWGVAFAIAGNVAPKRLDDMVSGLVTGTNPDSKEYWGKPADYDQRAVEMASIAATLLENPDFSKSLGEEGASNIFTWLSGIHSIDMPQNNWRFFRVLTLKALAACGQPIDKTLLAEELDFIDSQYRGGGWYGDHRCACRDYYTAFAFHYYGLLYARWFMNSEPERCTAYINRAREFALRYRYWFDDDGSQIAYGRSLTYRFASSCFWPLLATFGHPEMSAGVLRGLWSRNIEWWIKNPDRVFDRNGCMTIGYGYPNLLMSEVYNSPQSPLWSLKSFFPLALDETEPFWNSQPEPCPYPSDMLVDKEGGFLAERRQGGAYILTGAPVAAELRSSIDKYMKFAYSSRHGFGVDSTSWIRNGCVGDNVFLLRAHDHWFGRESLLDSFIVDKTLVTQWSPLPGCHIETRQEFTAEGELRQHMVELPETMEFIVTGHAADLFTRSGFPGSSSEMHEAAATGATLFSGIADVDKKYSAGIAPLAPNTNLMFPQSAAPYLTGFLPKGRSFLKTLLRYGKNS